MTEPPADPADSLPPHNLEAEQALIGSLLLDRDAICAVADLVRPDAFYHGANGILFQAIRALWQVRRPTDLVTLTDLLIKRNMLDAAGGIAYISSLIGAVPTAVHVQHYAEIVMNDARSRALIDAGAWIVGRAYKPDIDADELVSRIRSADAAFSLPSPGSSLLETMDAHRDHVLNRWEGRLVDQFMSTGIGSLDRLMLGGLRPGDLCYLGGRPGAGKTSIALQVARAVAGIGKRCLFVELEMSREAMLNRLIAAEAKVPFAVAYQRMGDTRHREAWLSATERLGQLPIDLDGSLRTTQKIAAACRRTPYAAVMVDHLDLLNDPDIASWSPEARTAETSKRLRRIVQDLGVSVIALVQLSRAVEAAPPFRPALNHFKHSGGIEQDADYAFLLYRRKYYVDRGLLESDPDDYLHGEVQRAELIVAKNRNGEASPITLGWLPASMSFCEEMAS